MSRNRKRFPSDFAFDLTKRECANLMLQSATSSSGYGGRRKLPFVFTDRSSTPSGRLWNHRLSRSRA
ncbi:MAG: ORF6N domain-containing protein [Elusimicrobia bacterium]|nr:ORF6N domain-containing protein [Elusimicrobiota bacterium]